MPESAKAITVPFETADAEQVTFSLDNERRLRLRFVDWREQPVAVEFTAVVALR